MKIEIAGPMEMAHREGVDTYTPVVDGRELEPEFGNAEVTLRNLSKIVNPNRRVVSFVAARGQVLVVFNTGETFLATGFGYGHLLEETERFAEFASKHGFGEKKRLLALYSTLKPEFSGPFPTPDERFTLEPESGELVIHQPAHAD